MSYAIRALLLLNRADPGLPVSCSELASEGKMPERFLLQILRSLVNHGVLESIRGAEGGYLLARSASKITLLDLFEALNEPIVTKTPALDDIPARSRRTLRRALKRVSAAVRRELGRVSLAQIGNGNKPRARSR
jgi:Rrf2 family protein